MRFGLVEERRDGIAWPELRELDRYAEGELGLEFEVFPMSREGGHRSGRAYQVHDSAALVGYARGGGRSTDFIVASGFPHLPRSIPETRSGDDNPAMRAVVDCPPVWIENNGPPRKIQCARAAAQHAMGAA